MIQGPITLTLSRIQIQFPHSRQKVLNIERIRQDKKKNDVLHDKTAVSSGFLVKGPLRFPTTKARITIVPRTRKSECTLRPKPDHFVVVLTPSKIEQ